MKYDIEAYLEGNLKGTALASFEEELANNPAFRAEVALQRQIAEGLKMQLLREQVTEVLTKDNGTDGSGKFTNTTLLGILLGLAVILSIGGYFMFSQDHQSTEAEKLLNKVKSITPTPNETIIPPSTTPPVLEEIQTIPPPTESKPTPSKEPKTSTPIAQNNPSSTLPTPLFPAPTVRGNQAENEDWKTLLDAIWYTDFPPANTVTFGAIFEASAKLLAERNFSNAYVQLQRLERKNPANDTLYFLKAYCLLEMGEGEEANRYFEKQTNPSSAWEAPTEWYRGLALLIAGDKAKAISVFEKIGATPSHPYRAQSLKALKLLQ